jgi:hypothetical protein
MRPVEADGAGAMGAGAAAWAAVVLGAVGGAGPPGVEVAAAAVTSGIALQWRGEAGSGVRRVRAPNRGAEAAWR